MKLLKKYFRLAFFYLLKSKCVSGLVFSKSMIGCFLFLGIGLFLSLNHLWNDQVLDYLKYVGSSFFLSRGLDNLSNIHINHGDKQL